MATRRVGKTKLTPEVRQRLAEVAREAREVAAPIGSKDRTLETEGGGVS